MIIHWQFQNHYQKVQVIKIVHRQTQLLVTIRDAPVPVPDWVTGYQSDRSPSRTGHPVGLVPSPDWVTGPTGSPLLQNT